MIYPFYMIFPLYVRPSIFVSHFLRLDRYEAGLRMAANKEYMVGNSLTYAVRSFYLSHVPRLESDWLLLTR